VPISGSPWFTAAWYPLLALAAHRSARRRPDPEAGLEPLASSQAAGHVLPEAAAFAPALARLARPRAIALSLVAVVSLSTALTGPDGRLHLTVLDIGQGDAILVEAPSGASALVDGGPDPDRTLRELGQTLPFHRRRIDVLVVTHPHVDHFGGVVEVLRRYDVGSVVHAGRPAENEAYRRLLETAAAEPGGRVSAAEAGQRIAVGEVTLEVLFPTADDVTAPLPDDDLNNGSVVILLRYRGFEALLTGDAEAPVEALLADRGQLRPVDVLKVGHHGSDSGTTPGFVAATRPRLALISVGEGNTYGHPHRSTLSNLAESLGVRVLRTDVDGRLEVVTDGVFVWVHTGRGSIGPLPAGGRPPPASAAGTIGR
jgi:competence protein ComEC